MCNKHEFDYVLHITVDPLSCIYCIAVLQRPPSVLIGNKYVFILYRGQTRLGCSTHIHDEIVESLVSLCDKHLLRYLFSHVKFNYDTKVSLTLTCFGKKIFEEL